MKRLLILTAVLLISATPIENQVRRLQASFISNFPAYVSWPAQTYTGHRNQLLIGLIGPDPLTQAGRSYLRGRGYGNTEFVIERVSPQAENLSRYQILYIEGLDKKQTKAILKKVAKKPVLTVGMQPGFLEMGGIVNFLIRGNAVNFYVSFANGEKAGLKINPYLAKYGQTL